MTKLSINQFLQDPKNNSDKYSNFYDWFCKDESLERRMMSMVPKLKFLVKEGIIDGDKNYVWFKNNCPMDGQLYDDMRISGLGENDLFKGGFCPKTGHYNVEDKCSVWTLKGEYKEYNFKNWNTFKKEVKNNPEFKQVLIESFK